jgi:hypothetical protein
MLLNNTTLMIDSICGFSIGLFLALILPRKRG